MKQTLKLSFEMTDVLSRIEHNGLKINLDTLDQIEKEYWGVMKSFLIYLNMLEKHELKGVQPDENVFNILRKL